MTRLPFIDAWRTWRAAAPSPAAVAAALLEEQMRTPNNAGSEAVAAKP